MAVGISLAARSQLLRQFVVWSFLCITSLVGLAGEPSQTKLANSLPQPEFAATKAAAGSTNDSLLQHEVSEVLMDWRKLAPTNNLTASNESLSQREQAQQADAYRELFENARRLRTAELNGLAKSNFVALLRAPAADELHRASMLELATMAQSEGQLAKAQQILAQYLSRWPQDPSAPEILLRQGQLYREMGALNMALTKFHAVITTALVLKSDHLEYFQSVVLQAQTEIAETQLALGNPEDAVASLRRLLKLDAPTLNRNLVQLKLLRCLAAAKRQSEIIAESRDILRQTTNTVEEPEVRFHLAGALKALGRKEESLHEVLTLLKQQIQGPAAGTPAVRHWQQRTGNEIANQLYGESDFLGALQVYEALYELDGSLAWQIPILYQIGLCFEHLDQPSRAAEAFHRIMERDADLKADGQASLKFVMEMARWRKELIEWRVQKEAEQRRSLGAALVPSQAPSALIN